jgi:hypothetical protein
MSIGKIILYAFLAWILYQFIFKLVIPIYRASRKIKKGFREMQEKMNQQYQEQQQQHNPSPGSKTGDTPKAPAGDYIDFEEVKYDYSH